MKLVFTSYSSSPEYTEPNVWLERINAYTGILENLSFNNTTIGIERIDYEGEYEQNGVHYFFIKLKNKVVRFPWRMHKLIKKLKADVVFVNGFIFPFQIIQLRLALGRSVKIIVLHRAEKPFNGPKKHLQQLADKCVNAYLFTSAEFGEQWIKNGNIKRQEKIHEVIQASSVFFPGNQLQARAELSVTGLPVFLWVGRLDTNKDPITVVKAFIRLLHSHPNAKLYMIYQTEELLQDVKRLVEANASAKDAIRLIGKVPHLQLQKWYNAADFIISSSHYEGSGVAVCEAMSCGCIPIVTNIVSFRRMTGPGKCGLLYEPGNTEALLNTLLYAIQMDLECESKKVLQQFQAELSFQAIATKINSIILSL
jgi:glycosyltransferase involved in cell wall biosynthesis